MQVLILAAGYGTRLYPLTKDKPKPLLPCNEKPIINYLLDKVKDFRSLSEVIVVTNNRFSGDFEKWAKEQKKFPAAIRVVNDGTMSPEDRLGAMGDIHFVLKNEMITDDLLVMGGDNLFDYSLTDYVRVSQEKRPSATIGLYDLKSKEKAKIFGVVAIDENKKITSFEEKPKEPKSTLIAMCLYYLPKESFRLIDDYLKSAKSADTTGDYINWLSKQQAVYGFRFEGRWYDIGSIEAYHEAQADFKLINERKGN